MGNRLSVLVPTYRRPQILKQCLQSIADAKVNAFEVIIGDDGGDIETQRVCDEYKSKLPIVYLAPDGKGSLASNISRLVLKSTGDWVLLIHDDDFLVGDHSSYPEKFSSNCDFYFTDHWVSNAEGEIDEENSFRNSIHYGRSQLTEGIQEDSFDLTFNKRVCLDGFYVNGNIIRNSILPNPKFGSVADYFWIFEMLNSGIKIFYSNERTFSYRTSPVGLTASGLSIDTLNGLYELKKKYNDPKIIKLIEKEISCTTWAAVNSCIQKNMKGQAWNYLRKIHFRYSHSLKHQFLLGGQLIMLILPLKYKTHNK